MGWLRNSFARVGIGAAAPPDAAAELAHGAALLGHGQFAPAVDVLQRALALAKPGDGVPAHQAHFLLARAYVGLGRLAQASMSFEAAVRANPDFAEALEEGVRVLQELEAHEEAAEWLRRLVQLRPGTSSRIELAGQLRMCGRNGEAAALLGAVCDEEPRNVEAALLYHHVLVSLGELEPALVQIDRVLKMRKADAALLVNRAVPLARLGRQDQALACLSRALALEPNHARALANRASVLLSQLRVREAIAAAEAALKLHPADADLHWGLGAASLLIGDWERGWAESEWRTGASGYVRHVPELEQPRWRGENLAGRTIFLYPEQGFGDVIQFLRFVPEVARMADVVLLALWPELQPLVADALPANCRILTPGSAKPPFDFHCPVLSLPAVLGTTSDTLPTTVPYVRAPSAPAVAWAERLRGGGLKVGICWSGNPRHVADRHRSMSLAAMRSVGAEGCRFVTLQPGRRAGDEDVLAGWTELVDVGAQLRDFGDTAALIQALDVVVTVDTAVAHLAGALGKPVWILLPHWPEWRWLLERSDSPWYPTARLYRQRKLGDWGPVLRRVKADLAALAQGGEGPVRLPASA